MQTKREILVSKGWVQGVALVGLCGFLLLGILAYRTYTDEPPIPSKVIGIDGQLLFTGDDVLAGQEVFLKEPKNKKFRVVSFATNASRKPSPSMSANETLIPLPE